jgi:Dockerin type I domain
MRYRRHAVIAALTLISAFSASCACAGDNLPAISGSAEVEASPLSAPASTSVLIPPATLPVALQAQNLGSALNPGHAYASASVTGGLDPVVSVSVSAIGETTTNPNATGSFIAGATAILNYSFEIDGPATAGTIPVIAQGNDSISQTTYTGYNTVQVYTALYVNNASVLNETGGPFNTTILLHVGTVYNVHMEASAAVQVVPNEALATAYVDPSFTIDPSYSNTYSIEYSDGLIQAATPRGDFNFDGHVTSADVQPMLAALTDLHTFQSNHNLSDADLLMIADVNADGIITNADLQALLKVLASGQGSGAQAVPEPSGIQLAAIAGLLAFVVCLSRLSGTDRSIRWPSATWHGGLAAAGFCQKNTK